MKAPVTIAVTKVCNLSACGVIEYDESDNVVSFTEKPEANQVLQSSAEMNGLIASTSFR